MAATYIECGRGSFVNTDHVTEFQLSSERLNIYTSSNRNLMFQPDEVAGEEVAQRVLIALLAELGKPPADGESCG